MKEVMVRIKSMQVSREAGSDEMEFVTEAKLYKRNGALYLLYEESEFSGMPGCRTRLRLRDDEVQMKRFGEGAGIGNELRFKKGSRYTGLYETPFGPIEMEVLTNDVASTISEEGTGQVDIDYEVSLKGLLEGRNRMNITLM
ncbi:MAG: DUF1934 domain-containing protein [Bacillota bacterium]|nr:DUF1934 domain-containing protein [Clostridiales bacterium]MDD6764253.1 DUF1934 domain-containing protein [Bacillota bacterium]MDY5607296.1 DUF1934 domain-containing protein [Lentihominibacter sp.]MCI7392554.1 DUF1934 domain-containing protein [Clostridiales bacterium]MDD6979134.1 DUF1934 domain-containing protein [Bacillota bacterium]